MNKPLLNVKKTKAIMFLMPQKKVQLSLLRIAESNIEYVDNFNFLGITINKHLNWASHIHVLATKISKTIGVLNRQTAKLTKYFNHFLHKLIRVRPAVGTAVPNRLI